MELRVPTTLLTEAIADKAVKQLRIYLTAKLLHNSRADIHELIEAMDIHPKTGGRLIKSIIAHGWAGTDGTFIFPRAWHRLKIRKRGGLYLVNTLDLADVKRFEALCFAWSLKKLYSRKKGPSSRKRRATPKDLSFQYNSQSLGIKERRCKSLRSQAQKYGFITINRAPPRVIGFAHQLAEFRKNIHGPPIFRKGAHICTVGDVSTITFHI